jgi:protein SCO1
VLAGRGGGAPARSNESGLSPQVSGASISERWQAAGVGPRGKLNMTAAKLCALALSLAASACQNSQPAKVGDEPPGFGGDFSLTTQDGKRFDLRDVRGRAVLLFFGYTSCPDMCPMTMSRIASALDRLGSDASQVVTLFVSVDPKRDTPAVLKEYVGSFSTPLIGLTGSPDEVAHVTSSYHATYELVDNGSPNYLVNHTTAIFLIDKQGKLRQFYAYNENPDTLAAALKRVLKEN